MAKRTYLSKIKPMTLGASMADLAMLLLIFFMTTTTTEPPQGVDVTLPKAKTEGTEQDSVYITIGNNGAIYLDSNMINLEQLQDNLAMRQSEKDRVVAVTADKDLPYSTVQKVLDVLRDQDFLNVVFMSEPNEFSGDQ